MGAPGPDSWMFAVAYSSRYSTRSRLLLTGLAMAMGVLTLLLYLAVSHSCRRRPSAEDHEAGGITDAAVIAVADAQTPPMDCAVCLGLVEAGEKLRRLPRCSHLFHADCVHAWLRAHSTCPMCRAATNSSKKDDATTAAAATAALPPGVTTGSAPPAALETVNGIT
ncbi:unnamed protein product [Triticum aestivum]|uniref:RING-type E3 ubiquitin transferase n=1 Tax=Triticum aestivum TaxID=4565 RepID=A0A7H4LR33_WHEAT|nr:RING-H2 finger protein ATL66-like [Triticum aestivum]SPT21072.1 unnamed protein product [Triticum aestivum]